MILLFKNKSTLVYYFVTITWSYCLNVRHFCTVTILWPLHGPAVQVYVSLLTILWPILDLTVQVTSTVQVVTILWPLHGLTVQIDVNYMPCDNNVTITWFYCSNVYQLYILWQFYDYHMILLFKWTSTLHFVEIFMAITWSYNSNVCYLYNIVTITRSLNCLSICQLYTLWLSCDYYMNSDVP